MYKAVSNPLEATILYNALEPSTTAYSIMWLPVVVSNRIYFLLHSKYNSTLCHAVCNITSSTCQGIYAEAESALKESEAIYEKAYGLYHPNVGNVIVNRAALATRQVRTG